MILRQALDLCMYACMGVCVYLIYVCKHNSCAKIHAIPIVYLLLVQPSTHIHLVCLYFSICSAQINSMLGSRILFLLR